MRETPINLAAWGVLYVFGIKASLICHISYRFGERRASEKMAVNGILARCSPLPPPHGKRHRLAGSSPGAARRRALHVQNALLSGESIATFQAFPAAPDKETSLPTVDDFAFVVAARRANHCRRLYARARPGVKPFPFAQAVEVVRPGFPVVAHGYNGKPRNHPQCVKGDGAGPHVLE